MKRTMAYVAIAVLASSAAIADTNDADDEATDADEADEADEPPPPPPPKKTVKKTKVKLNASADADGDAEVKPLPSRGHALILPAASLKFADVVDSEGVQMALVDGDPAKGPAHFMIKFDKGFSAPVHHHSADHHVTVVSGTVVLTIGGKDIKLGPGSFFSLVGGKAHATRCERSACVISVDARAPWDVVPEAVAANPPQED